MWNDTSWLEKERDTNIVEEWGGNQRLVIRNPVPPEPTRPYNTRMDWKVTRLRRRTRNIAPKILHRRKKRF